MRKLVLVLGIAVGLALGSGIALTPTASANNGPHGGYTLTTDACAGCHRAHTAIGDDYLLVESDIYELCVSCHGGSVQTNVVSGSRTGDGKKLNGGGFVTMPWSLNAAGTPTTPTSKAVQSSHTVAGLPVNGTPATGSGTAWGSGSSGQGVTGTLECTSCHNPHGSSNYRILNSGSGTPSARWVPSDPGLMDFRNYEVVATADDFFNYAEDSWVTPLATITATPTRRIMGHFTTGYVSGSGWTGQMLWGNGTPAAYGTPTGMSAWCGTCHKQYVVSTGARTKCSNPADCAADWTPTPTNTPGVGTPTALPSTPYPSFYNQGTQDIGDGAGSIARYRHSVIRSSTSNRYQPVRYGSISIAATPTGTPGAPIPSDQVNSPQYQGFSCLTCHYAHGTAAVAGGYAAGVAPTNDSALLYYDNRGVCRACHNPEGS